MLLLLLTAVCTSCRLQHTKARKKSDFDDGEGAEKVSGIPNASAVLLLIVMGVRVWGYAHAFPI